MPFLHTCAAMISVRNLELRLGDLNYDSAPRITARLECKIANFPLEPELANLLMSAEAEQCSKKILTIVSLLTVQNVFLRPKNLRIQADRAKVTA